MAASDRPGGLTALAIVNFLFAVLNLFALLFLVVGGVVLLSGAGSTGREGKVFTGRELHFAVIMLVVAGAWALIETALLVLTGVGYLRQKRILGWGLGVAYGILGIACNLAVIETLPEEMGGGSYTIDKLTGLFYPAFTLLLLCLVFRRDFRR